MPCKIKPFVELTFADDFMFNKVMHDPEICAEVIERLLHIKVDHIVYPEIQKSLQPYYTSKGVRFDVYLKDSDRVFDIELQNRKEDYLGKRMRYYQSMIDIDNLLRGEDYINLKESYVIFICNHDPFNLDSPCYTFKNLCLERPEAELNDRTTKVVYNVRAYENAKDENLKNFLRFICNNYAGDAFTDRLNELVTRIKYDNAYKMEYMTVTPYEADIRREGLREGRAEGARENALQSALNLLKMNLGTPEQIAQATGLSLDEVLTLQKEL